MQKVEYDPMSFIWNPGKKFLRSRHTNFVLLALLLLSIICLAGCGGGSSSSSQNGGPLAGNWQFSMVAPTDNSFVGLPGCDSTDTTNKNPLCMGGSLLQANSSVSGGLVYSIAIPHTGAPPTLCSSGSAPVSGSINGQNVTLTVSAGAVTFTLTGTLSSDGSTMAGTYTSTDGQGCGTAQSGLNWHATLVPPVTGAVQGSFHSVTSGSAHLNDENFAVTGNLQQGANVGASNTTVTGTLTFQNYPCLATANVRGNISGNSLVLQVFGGNGAVAGQIGAPMGFHNPAPVFVDNTSAGYVMHGTTGYGVTTKLCPGGNLPGDIGDICLALNNGTACTQPILLTPGSLVFPPQGLGSPETGMDVTVTNTDPSGATLSGLTVSWQPQAGNPSPFGLSDFNGLPNFLKQDSCSSTGGSFSLAPQQSCTIRIVFSPQQSCPWLPSLTLGGEPPSLCPFPLFAKLKVNSPKSADSDKAFAVSILGVGLSSLTPSTPELDYGSEAVSEKSDPQSLSFTNQGAQPVQILPSLGPCVNPPVGPLTLPRPLVPGSVSDFQVVQGNITPDGSTIQYFCDSDLTTKEPNFQITNDTCSGRVLNPTDSCTLDVTFVPQPSTSFIPALDYFLELNTLQCTPTVTKDCEIDSGRFPVELKANTPSPLRMSPAAGIDFGVQSINQTAGPVNITLYNDPKDPNSQTINFTGNVVKGDYAETDNCGPSLAPGGTCTLSITFTPRVSGFDPGTLTITYPVAQTQIVYLRGSGQ